MVDVPNCSSLNLNDKRTVCSVLTPTIYPGDFYTISLSSAKGSKAANGESIANQLDFFDQGGELAKIIAEVKSANNATKVMLVGHSMGGLAARAYLQSLAFQPGIGRIPYGGDVARLVTVGTPHLGSPAPYYCQSVEKSGLMYFDLLASLACNVGAGGSFTMAMEILKEKSVELSTLNTNISRLPPINYTSIVVDTNLVLGGTTGIVGDGIVTVESQNLASLTLPSSITSNGLHKLIPLSLFPPPWQCPLIAAESHTCETDLPEVQNNIEAELLSIPLILRPHVNTSLPTSLASNGAILNAGVDPFGISTSAWFEWGTSRSQFDVVIGPTQLIETAHQSVAAGSNWLNISQNITGLAGNTPYYYRAVAQHIGAGTPIIKGAVLQFTTPPAGSTVLPAPTLTAPAQYAFDQLTTPSFSWAAVPNASTYRIMVTSDPSALPTDPCYVSAFLRAFVSI